MVLHSDDSAAGCLGSSDDGIRIKRFDGEWIDHTDHDSRRLQLLVSLHGLLQRDAGGYDCHFVIGRFTDNLTNGLTVFFTLTEPGQCGATAELKTRDQDVPRSKLAWSNWYFP